VSPLLVAALLSELHCGGGQKKMDEFMRNSRNTLNEWAYEHFKGLEEAVKNSEETTAKLTRVVREQETEIVQLEEQLRGAGDGAATAKQVGERDAEIAQLKQQLQDARDRIATLTALEEKKLEQRYVASLRRRRCCVDATDIVPNQRKTAMGMVNLRGH